MRTSFIVPAYNEERLIGAALASIHGAARALGLDYELIVADDASTDATARLAQEAGARVVTVSHRKISATRNSGARAATGERLVFVDADSRIDAAVLRAAMAALDAGAVGGGAGIRFDPAAPRWAEAGLRLSVWIVRVSRMAAGCFVFATRAAFEAAGGFDEDYYGAEELVLSAALKRQGRFVVLRESVATSPRKFTTRSMGQTLGEVLRLAVRGPRGLRGRRGMGFWYDGKR
jgi:glycosyltransferase involved in cell wall biosynthesis